MGTINLNPGRPSLYARDLTRLIQMYLEDLASEVQPITVDGYACKLVYVARWWQAYGAAHEWQLTRRDLEEFERWLRLQCGSRTHTELSYHTRKDILRRLRQVFLWAVQNDHVDRDYSKWVPAPEGEPPKRTAATLPKLRSLFQAAARSAYPIRDQAILALLIGTGIRRGECVSIRAENMLIYADDSGTATVIGKRTRANKSGRREIAFDAACGYYLRRLLDFEGRSSGPLFLGSQGPLKVIGIYKVLKRCVRLAGLTDTIQGCHDLRRAFATILAKQAQSDVDADRLRRQMGHTTYRMTAEYTLLDAEDIREGFISPMAWIRDGTG